LPKRLSKSNVDHGPKPKVDRKEANKDQRRIRKEINNLEKKIAQLDDKKRELNKQLLETTDTGEAMRLHTEMTAIGDELTAAEERWCELN